MDQLIIKTALTNAKPGLDKYLKIMDMVKKVDVSQNEEYQKLKIELNRLDINTYYIGKELI